MLCEVPTVSNHCGGKPRVDAPVYLQRAPLGANDIACCRQRRVAFSYQPSACSLLGIEGWRVKAAGG